MLRLHQYLLHVKTSPIPSPIPSIIPRSFVSLSSYFNTLAFCFFIIDRFQFPSKFITLGSLFCLSIIDFYNILVFCYFIIDRFQFPNSFDIYNLNWIDIRIRVLIINLFGLTFHTVEPDLKIIIFLI